MDVSGNFSQTAAGGLEDEVIAGAELAGKGGGEEAGAVPALGANVHEQDDPMAGIRVVQAVEGGFIGGARFIGHRKHAIRRITEGHEFRFDEGAGFLEIGDLGEVERELRGMAGGQGDGAVFSDEVVENGGEKIVEALVVEGVGVDVSGDGLENAVLDACGEAIPENHVEERLAFQVGRAGSVYDCDEIRLAVEIVDGFPDALEAFFHARAVSVVGFIRKHGEVGQAGDGLEATIGEVVASFIGLRFGENAFQIALADAFLGDADFLRVGDDDVERIAADDRNVRIAVAGEDEFHRGGEVLEETRWQDPVERHRGDLAQRAHDREARSEDEGVLDEGAVGIFERHCELGGDDGTDEGRFPRTHGKGENVAGVVEGDGFAEAVELVGGDECIVIADFCEEAFEGDVLDDVADGIRSQAEGFAKVRLGRIDGLVKVQHRRSHFNEPEIPVSCQRIDLS